MRESSTSSTTTTTVSAWSALAHLILLVLRDKDLPEKARKCAMDSGSSSELGKCPSVLQDIQVDIDAEDWDEPYGLAVALVQQLPGFDQLDEEHEADFGRPIDWDNLDEDDPAWTIGWAQQTAALLEHYL